MCGQHVKWLEQPDGTHYLANIPGFEKHKCAEMNPIKLMVSEKANPIKQEKINGVKWVQELEDRIAELERSIDIIVQIIERTK